MTPDTLSPDVLAELAKLRDIRVPTPIGWWPLAYGWWVLMVLCLVVLATGIALDLRRRRTLRFAALSELYGLEDQLKSNGDTHRIAVDLAVLVRRITLRSDKSAAQPGLEGDAWADALATGEAGFSRDAAALLAQAPYAPTFGEDIRDKLTTAFSESERWIKRNA